MLLGVDDVSVPPPSPDEDVAAGVVEGAAVVAVVLAAASFFSPVEGLGDSPVGGFILSE